MENFGDLMNALERSFLLLNELEVKGKSAEMLAEIKRLVQAVGQEISKALKTLDLKKQIEEKERQDKFRELSALRVNPLAETGISDGCESSNGDTKHC